MVVGIFLGLAGLGLGASLSGFGRHCLLLGVGSVNSGLFLVGDGRNLGFMLCFFFSLGVSKSQTSSFQTGFHFSLESLNLGKEGHSLLHCFVIQVGHGSCVGFFSFLVSLFKGCVGCFLGDFSSFSGSRSFGGSIFSGLSSAVGLTSEMIGSGRAALGSNSGFNRGGSTSLGIDPPIGSGSMISIGLNLLRTCSRGNIVLTGCLSAVCSSLDVSCRSSLVRCITLFLEHLALPVRFSSSVFSKGFSSPCVVHCSDGSVTF